MQGTGRVHWNKQQKRPGDIMEKSNAIGIRRWWLEALPWKDIEQVTEPATARQSLGAPVAIMMSDAKVGNNPGGGNPLSPLLPLPLSINQFPYWIR